MVTYKEEKILKCLIEKYNLGKIKSIELFSSSQNKVYKVETINGIYVVKEYSKDAIKNQYLLKKRTKQIIISELFNKNSIKTSIPISFNNKYILYFENKYFCIYKYIESSHLLKDEISLKHIRVLSKTLSKIHKLNLIFDLPCFYKKININFNKYLKKSKKINEELFLTLKNNLIELTRLIEECNKNIKSMKSNLCVSHNDYKLLNIMWNDLDMILLDFDACGMSNPTCCMCESAFNFSYSLNGINYDFYREFIKEYIKNYGELKDDLKKALYVSMNGKLQWFSYMLSKIGNENNNYIEETIYMIEELKVYYDNIKIFYNIYLDILKD